jgi:outer membrane receptor protein involved in Fe transport
MSKLMRRIGGAVVVVLLAAFATYGGNTGKIAGRVTDAETGEPLIGVNVIIEGTTMGAATNIDGEYVIINVPPGTYAVVASALGYGKKKFTDVVVNIDFTTRLDIELGSESVQLEEVVVQAERKMVRKDLTSSRKSVTSAEIEALPVESVAGILTLQAGITEGVGGELHIRGGRSSEILYTINGISTANPFSNSQAISIATNAIQELSVVSGTFNAEYGNALSGVVNSVTKEGGKEYSGNVSAYAGDYVSMRDEIWSDEILTLNPLNNVVGEATFGGPIPMTNNVVTFFLSGRYSSSDGYLYGVRRHIPADSVVYDYETNEVLGATARGDDEVTPMSTSWGLNSTGKLSFKPTTTLKIHLDGLYTQGESQSYSHDFKYNPDGRGTGYSRAAMGALTITHAVMDNTYYTVKGAYNVNDYQSYLYQLMGPDGSKIDYYAGRDDIDPNSLRASDQYVPSHKTASAASYTFLAGGDSKSHYYQRSQTMQGKVDLTSQINVNHEVKLGGQIRLHTMDYDSFSILYDTLTYTTPTVPDADSPYRDLYTKKPWEASAYIQDKIEYTNIILNIGVRYDAFMSNSRYAPNTFLPSPNVWWTIPENLTEDDILDDAPIKHMVSPRLGISFPITDEGVIHFSYGHFYQMPPFRNLYVNPNFEFRVGDSPTFGDANLNPEKTVAYEIGLQQQLMPNLAIDVTTFFKDVRDLLATQKIRIDDDKVYYKYVNKDYANIKGVTFSVTKRKAQDLFGATLDYTLQVAEGNEVNADAFYVDAQQGKQTEKIPVPLGWDLRHQLNATVTVGESKNWHASVVGQMGTGLPYTPTVYNSEAVYEVYSSRRPVRYSVDLLVEKEFYFVENVGITIFARVYNLFDQLVERYIYTDTGRSTYTLLENTPQAETTDEIAKNAENVSPSSEYFNRPQYYQAPRSVRIGLSVDF